MTGGDDAVPSSKSFDFSTNVKEFQKLLQDSDNLEDWMDCFRKKSFTSGKIRSALLPQLIQPALDQLETQENEQGYLTLLSLIQDTFLLFPGDFVTMKEIFHIANRVYRNCKNTKVRQQMVVVLETTLREILGHDLDNNNTNPNNKMMEMTYSEKNTPSFSTLYLVEVVYGLLNLHEFCLKEGFNFILLNLVWKGIWKIITTFQDQFRQSSQFQRTTQDQDPLQPSTRDQRLNQDQFQFQFQLVLDVLESYLRQVITNLHNLFLVQTDVSHSIRNCSKILQFYLNALSNILRCFLDLMEEIQIKKYIQIYSEILEILYRYQESEGLQPLFLFSTTSFTRAYFSNLFSNEKRCELMQLLKPPSESIGQFFLYLSCLRMIPGDLLEYENGLLFDLWNWSFHYILLNYTVLLQMSSHDMDKGIHLMEYIRESLTLFILKLPPKLHHTILNCLLKTTFSQNPLCFEISSLLWIDLLTNSNEAMQKQLVSLLLQATIEVHIEKTSTLCRILRRILPTLTNELQSLVFEEIIQDLLLRVFDADSPPKSTPKLQLELIRLDFFPAKLFSSTIHSKMPSTLFEDCLDCCYHSVKFLTEHSTVSHKEEVDVAVYTGLVYLKGLNVNDLDKETKKRLAQIYIGVLFLTGSSRIANEVQIVHCALEGVSLIFSFVETIQPLFVRVLSCLLHVLKSSKDHNVQIVLCLKEICGNHISPDVNPQILSLYKVLFKELFQLDMWIMDALTIQCIVKFAKESNAAEMISLKELIPQHLSNYFLKLLNDPIESNESKISLKNDQEAFLAIPDDYFVVDKSKPISSMDEVLSFSRHLHELVEAKVDESNRQEQLDKCNDLFLSFMKNRRISR